jgi:hypothetical protein
VIVGRDGVSHVGPGVTTRTVQFAGCVAGIYDDDGSLTLVGRDGTTVTLHPTFLRRGVEAIQKVEAALPGDLLVPSFGRRGEIEAIAREKLHRRWVVWEEIDRLAEVLDDGERILTLTEAIKGWKVGLIALTDKRLLFISTGPGRDVLLAMRYDEMLTVGKTPGPIGFDVVIRTRGGRKLRFSDVAPRARKRELRETIRARLVRDEEARD